MYWSRKAGVNGVLVAAVILLFSCSTFISNASATSWSWTGYADAYPFGSSQKITGVQDYRYNSNPSNIPTGAGYCSTLLGHNADGSNQPFIFQNLTFVSVDPSSGQYVYNLWGTIHQCQGYEWYLFLFEEGSYVSPIWSVSTTGSTVHHFYEFINNASTGDKLAAQLDGTVESFQYQQGQLGTAVTAQVLSTAQNAVTTYQDSQLNYDINFTGWTSFSMAPGDTLNNNATNSNGQIAMCSYVVSGSVANFGENTSNMTNCT